MSKGLEPAGEDIDYWRVFSKEQLAVREVLIGSDLSMKIKRRAVYRGFMNEAGFPRRNLTWIEKLVVSFREETTQEGYNHEWWAAEVSKPRWAQRLDAYYGESWLWFPRPGAELTAKALGERIGEQITLSERLFARAMEDTEFCGRLEAAQFGPKYLAISEPSEVWQQCVADAVKAIPVQRAKLLSKVGKTAASEGSAFLEGFVKGREKGFMHRPRDTFRQHA